MEKLLSIIMNISFSVPYHEIISIVESVLLQAFRLSVVYDHVDFHFVSTGFGQRGSDHDPGHPCVRNYLHFVLRYISLAEESLQVADILRGMPYRHQSLHPLHQILDDGAESGDAICG